MKLLIKFPDASQSFCNGVEFGRLLQKMENGEDAIHNCKFPIRIENKLVIENACAEYGYIPIFGEIYFDEWIDFIAVRKVSTEN